MPHTLLPTGDEGKDKRDHAMGGTENDTLSSDSRHPASAPGEWGRDSTGMQKAFQRNQGRFEPALSPQRFEAVTLDERGKRVNQSIIEAVSESMGRNLSVFMLQSAQTRSAGRCSRRQCRPCPLP